jgi:hypothetical protein
VYYIVNKKKRDYWSKCPSTSGWRYLRPFMAPPSISRWPQPPVRSVWNPSYWSRNIFPTLVFVF